ncbi:MAG: PD40 domain-containing protein, partial [Prevotella sp.]|nr:PD40 domain-containing protein [Prevotella sp.]
MKKSFPVFMLFGALVLVSCGGSKAVVDTAAPEEQALNIQKITDESSNTVLGASTSLVSGKKGGLWSSLAGMATSVTAPANFAISTRGGCKSAKYYWGTSRLLAMSPDGTELAYLNRSNKQDNIMIRRAATQGASTQRTFRDIGDFTWGEDGNLYFSDYSDGEHSQIGATNAHSGSIIRQLTSNNIDRNPILSKDGSLLLFTRLDKSGPSVWSLNLSDNTLTSCARGYDPCFIGDSKEEFLCVRNSTAGVSEIWKVNYVKGQETLI